MTQQKKARNGHNGHAQGRQQADDSAISLTPAPIPTDPVYESTRHGFTASVRRSAAGGFAWSLTTTDAWVLGEGESPDEETAISAAVGAQADALGELLRQKRHSAVSYGLESLEIGLVLRAVDEMVQEEVRLVNSVLGVMRAAMYHMTQGATGKQAKGVSDLFAALSVAVDRLHSLADAVNAEATAAGFAAKENGDE